MVTQCMAYTCPSCKKNTDFHRASQGSHQSHMNREIYGSNHY